MKEGIGGLLAALSLAALPGPVPAQTPGSDPFVFVSAVAEDGSSPDPATLAWYLLSMTIRPGGTSVAGIPVAAINEFRQRQMAERPALSVEPWCHANALSERSFASSNRVVQASIDRSFRENPDHHFQLRGRFTGGGDLLALVGHYQDCAGEIGSFIMLLDDATRPARVEYVDTLPYVGGLQYMRLVDGDIVVSTCFECGDATGLFYDRRRRRFYWEELGD